MSSGHEATSGTTEDAPREQGPGTVDKRLLQRKIAQRAIQRKDAAAPDHGPAAPSVAAQPGDVIDGYVIYPSEVRSGGTLAWRNNNPGNIRNGGFAEAHGAFAGKSNHGFAIFPTYEQGFAAIVALLQTAPYQAKTILDAMKMYAPPTDGNDPVAYANNIHTLTGLDVKRTLASLSDAELGQMAHAIQHVEGTVAGQTFARDDAKLPAAVRAVIGAGSPAPAATAHDAAAPAAAGPAPDAAPTTGAKGPA